MNCTICSLIPFAVREPNKPGLFPGEYPIPPSTGEPVLLIVKDGVRAQYNENYKIIDYLVLSSTIANSVVADYILGQQLTSADETPAIFWVEGEWTLEDLKKNFIHQIDAALARQDAWFKKLVKSADDVWQQHHQHKFITDLQRRAASFLNYKREWLDDSTDKIVKCPVCMTMISQFAMKCFACQAVVKPEAYKAYLDSIETVVHPPQALQAPQE